MADATWQQPYQQNYLDRAQTLGGAQYTPFGQSTTAAANPWQTSAWERTYNRGMQGAPEVSAARDQMTNTIQGGGFSSNPYLQGENPYLQQTIDSTLGDITRNYNQTVRPAMGTANVRSGSFGNSGLAETQANQERNLASELGRASSNLRYGDYTQRAQMYGQERDRQIQATQNAPSFANVDYTDLQAMQQAGNAAQGQQQNEITSNFNQYLDARSWPFQTLAAQSQAMGTGGGVNNATYGQSNKGANALGGALAGAQIGSSLGIGSGWGALSGGLLGLLG
jgi:hypothetical protein